MLLVVEEYAKKWRLTFNSKKCKVVVSEKNCRVGEALSGKKWPFAGSFFEEVTAAKYLGLIISRKSNDWRLHIDKITGRARGALSMALWLSKNMDQLDPRTCCTLFHSTIRSVCEYGAEIWWTPSISLENKIVRPFRPI